MDFTYLSSLDHIQIRCLAQDRLEELPGYSSGAGPCTAPPAHRVTVKSVCYNPAAPLARGSARRPCSPCWQCSWWWEGCRGPHRSSSDPQAEATFSHSAWGYTISAVNLSCKHSVPYLDEGKSADDDDPNAAEHDAQKIEQNSKLARLGTSLRILACRRGVQSWRSVKYIEKKTSVSIKSTTLTWSCVRRWQILHIHPLVERLHNFLDVLQKHFYEWRCRPRDGLIYQLRFKIHNKQQNIPVS